jgi:glyceraldehyde 3-phosphate dehydrogenase
MPNAGGVVAVVEHAAHEPGDRLARDSGVERGRLSTCDSVVVSAGDRCQAAARDGLIIPELNGKLDGLAVRVPTPNVSLVDLTVELERAATEEAVNAAMKEAAAGTSRGHPLLL